MHWLYHLTQPQPPNGAVAQKVYLRAVKPGMENAENRLVSQIIQINIFALDFYFGLADNPLDTEEGRQIYEVALREKEYFIQEQDLDESNEHLMASATMYLKTTHFDETELLAWVRVYLSVHGIEHETFEKTDLGYFPEMNAILSLFSLDNVRKFEDRLGKAWWEGDKRRPDPDAETTHKDE